MSANQDTTIAGPEYGRADSRQSRGSHKSAGRSTSASPETRLSSSRDSQRSKSSARKQPSYEESSLQIAGSPPLTSFLNDRHSASSAQEEAYLKHASRLRIARIVLSVLTIGTAVAAVGVTSHLLKSYNNTHLSSNWHLPLWPINIDIKPTLGLLIPAAIITVNCLCYIILAVIPSPHSRTSLLTNLYLLTTTLSLLLSIFALTFSPIITSHTDPSSPSQRETIHSFTCRLYRSANTFNSASIDMGIPIFGSGMNYPLGFKRMCMESEVGLGLMVAVGVLSLGGVGVGVWGLLKARGIERGRRARWGEKYGGEGKA